MRDEAGILLGVVPARGGSKRLPRKNVRPLGGRPLIAWTIDAARASGVLDEVLVSTDDPEIAAAARAAGASVPWLRPADLASDTATSVDVLRHALAWHESERGPVEAVVLLQPTSPFRSAASIRAAVAAFRAQPAPRVHAVASVSRASTHPAWCFTRDGDAMQPVLGWEPLRLRSQDLPPAWALNGAVYVVPTALLRSGAPLLGPGLRACVMDDPREALDIDDADDWRAAEALAAQLAGADPSHRITGRSSP